MHEDKITNEEDKNANEEDKSALHHRFFVVRNGITETNDRNFVNLYKFIELSYANRAVLSYRGNKGTADCAALAEKEPLTTYNMNYQEK